jgi:hypothetical protein
MCGVLRSKMQCAEKRDVVDAGRRDLMNMQRGKIS